MTRFKPGDVVVVLPFPNGYGRELIGAEGTVLKDGDCGIANDCVVNFSGRIEFCLDSVLRLKRPPNEDAAPSFESIEKITGWRPRDLITQ